MILFWKSVSVMEFLDGLSDGRMTDGTKKNVDDLLKRGALSFSVFTESRFPPWNVQGLKFDRKLENGKS